MNSPAAAGGTAKLARGHRNKSRETPVDATNSQTKERHPMAMSSTTSMSFTSDAAIDTYISGLKNAHALEKQATQLIGRQLERIENYPEVEQLLRRHLGETEQQIARIDEILHSFGEERSLLKDMATQL